MGRVRIKQWDHASLLDLVIINIEDKVKLVGGSIYRHINNVQGG